MGKLRVGNKQNSFLNGEWAKHVRGDFKKLTSGIRRAFLKKDLDVRLKEDNEDKLKIEEGDFYTDTLYED